LAKKKRVRQHIIADLSANHVERYILRCGFSAERVQHDYGIDLVLFTYDSKGEIEPGQVYIQLKATDHLTVLQDQQTVAFAVKRSDLALWLDEPMPYILILYDAQTDVAYWLYVQAYFERRPAFNLAQAGDIVMVHLPKSNLVSEVAVQRFAQFKNAVLHQVRRRGGVEHHE
jgi:hypothetical protein